MPAGCCRSGVFALPPLVWDTSSSYSEDHLNFYYSRGISTWLRRITIGWTAAASLMLPAR